MFETVECMKNISTNARFSKIVFLWVRLYRSGKIFLTMLNIYVLIYYIKKRNILKLIFSFKENRVSPLKTKDLRHKPRHKKKKNFMK